MKQCVEVCIYIFDICVPSVNLHMNYTQQKAVCKQHPDQMAADRVRLVWGRGRNYDAMSLWNTGCYSRVWDTVDQITWVWVLKYCSDCTSYCRSPLLSFVLILLPNARSLSHRCPHLKNKLLHLYWGLQGAGRMHRPADDTYNTYLYWNLSDWSGSRIYREMVIVYQILVSKPWVKRPLRK